MKELQLKWELFQTNLRLRANFEIRKTEHECEVRKGVEVLESEFTGRNLLDLDFLDLDGERSKGSEAG